MSATRVHILPLGIDNCYLLQGDGCVLVDGGAPGQEHRFFDQMATLGVPPERISLIVLTHAHWDHIGCARALTKATGARLAVHGRERDIVVNGRKSMPPASTLWGIVFGAVLRAFLPFIKVEPVAVDIEIGDDGMDLAPYGVNARVVYTPGHSPGSISVVLDSGEACVGDLAMNGLPLTFGPNLPIFADDMKTVRASWRKLLQLGVATIYPAHGRPFPVSSIEKRLT